MAAEYKVLLTGAGGFVGRHLAKGIHACNIRLLAVSRTPVDAEYPTEVIESLDDFNRFSRLVAGIIVVIHAAGRAHIMQDEVADPLSEYRRVNVEGTLKLAQQAAAAGVKRFIFISSIKVNGEATADGRFFLACDDPAPVDPYGLSKLEAEQGLMQLAVETGMEVVIIRPPLVYGPGVKGNFASLIKLVEQGLPLPLGAIHNKRSLVGIDNLVDLIIRCIDHPAASNQVFLAGDGEDLSTSELLRGLSKAMGKPARLFAVSPLMLQLIATVVGKGAMVQRLFGSLQVNISKTRELLDWTPPFTVEQGLRRCFEQPN